ncbi:MAG: hypothetical protein ACRC6O_10115 [Flavobacterium sp.]
MIYENYYGGMHIIWWIVWAVLLFWIFILPFDIPGQKRKKDTALNILNKKLAKESLLEAEYYAKKNTPEDEFKKPYVVAVNEKSVNFSKASNKHFPKVGPSKIVERHANGSNFNQEFGIETDNSSQNTATIKEEQYSDGSEKKIKQDQFRSYLNNLASTLELDRRNIGNINVDKNSCLSSYDQHNPLKDDKP